MAKIIMARAPVRNADLGGWRDTRLFSSGKVLNMAIRLYTYVSLVPMEESGYGIESHDMGGSEHVRSVREMEYAGALGLLKAAIGSAGAAGGLKLIVRSEAPPASGLGSSAALAVATLGALYRHEDACCCRTRSPRTRSGSRRNCSSSNAACRTSWRRRSAGSTSSR